MYDLQNIKMICVHNFTDDIHVTFKAHTFLLINHLLSASLIVMLVADKLSDPLTQGFSNFFLTSGPLCLDG